MPSRTHKPLSPILGAFFAALCLAPTLASAQNESAFDNIEACAALESSLAEIAKNSAELDTFLAQPPTSREAFLAEIFTGTQRMLALGEQIFSAADAHEEICKAALREADKALEIARIYDLILEPTIKGHLFLVRVRDAAHAMNDTATVADLDQAITEFRTAMLRMVDLCVADLGSQSDTNVICEELRRRLDARLR